MISDSLQERIHLGDRDAFRALYSEYSRDVYLTAQEALGNDASARAVVKQVFLRIHRELLDAEAPIDTGLRIDVLTNEEIRVQRIAAGDMGRDILKVHTPRRLNLRPEAPASEPAAQRPEPRPAFERAQVRYVQQNVDHAAHGAEPLPPKAQRGAGRVIGLILLVLFFLAFLWTLVGILASLGVLPQIDLGYSWFDRTVFQLFNLR